MHETTLAAFVATCAYLYLKMFANSGVQAYGKFKYRSHKYTEDSRLFGAPPNQGEQPEILMRAEAAWRNDLENIPMFIAAALCGLLTGVPESIYIPLLVAFCIGRTVHTVFLIVGKQPWRFLGYIAGVVCTGSMFIFSLRGLGW